MTEEEETSSGVRELVERLRDQGVKAAEAESERILTDAKRRAGAILTEAREAAAREQAAATEAIEREHGAALSALQLAARDASENLMQAMTGTFETHLRRLVTSELQDPAFLRDLVLSIAAAEGQSYAADRPVQLRLAASFFEGDDPAVKERTRAAVLGLSRQMLREGVELVPDPRIHAGVRVRIVGDNSELDLTDETLSALLLHHIVPRFRSILEGVE